MILLDTNLLTRMTRPHDPQSGVVRAAIQTLLGRGERLIVVPQNLYEFWAVATRPPGSPPAGRNGLGMTTGAGRTMARSFSTPVHGSSRPRRAEQALAGIGGKARRDGLPAHDVRLVAAMQSYGITRLLTFNAADFRGLAVVILDPAAV